MDETTTVVIVVVAAAGLFLLYESMQQQTALLEAQIAASRPASPTFGILQPFIGPIIAAL